MNDNIKLENATVEDKDCIKNLYQYYQHDLSEFGDTLQVNTIGMFDHSFVDSYFSEDHLIPMKITLQNQIIGFILCSIGQTVDYIIQDVFVLRNYRDRGFAKLALKQLFDLYAGKFGLDILAKNKPAKLFWEHCFEYFDINYQNYEVTENGDSCLRFIFDH